VTAAVTDLKGRAANAFMVSLHERLASGEDADSAFGFSVRGSLREQRHETGRFHSGRHLL
jgi:hypothetical protein